MKLVRKLTLDAERALYGENGVTVEECTFDGPLDGESALKECRNIYVKDSYFNLRYPFWHDNGVKLSNSRLTENCRAAFWYSDDVKIDNSKLHGIKAMRECSNVTLTDCDVVSAEFGWFSNDIRLSNCTVEGEYLFLRTSGIEMKDCRQKGKYSFQYVKNMTVENCYLDTKDAFWHAENVTVKNSTVKGEYLGWYSKGLTLINCEIIGTQPLCYCEGLRLIDCKMTDTDLSFERSEVNATLTSAILSIKNPLSGTVTVPEISEIIFDIPSANGVVNVNGKIYQNSLK